MEGNPIDLASNPMDFDRMNIDRMNMTMPIQNKNDFMIQKVEAVLKENDVQDIEEVFDSVTEKLAKINEERNILMNLQKQLTKKKLSLCDHSFIREYPSGPRDNGEVYYTCTKCGYSY
tara:strand:- start:419 stop:772 length:354 start_codon:yes stop_codon:yes gene_type:complete